MAETDREFDDLAELLSRKQNNLALQARLREESKKDTTLLAENFPSHYQKLSQALTTEISDRPYVNFLEKRKK